VSTARGTSWDPHRLPDQSGRTFVVTGGNTGIGYYVAEQLATTGGRVVIASRNAERSAAAIAAIRDRVPGVEIEHVPLDLASLASVRDAAGAIRALGGVDVLVNNAGLVLASRRRHVTADGLELEVGGNFLGHFALTAQVFEAIRPGGRIIGLGSLSTMMVRLDPVDLLSERRYGAFRAYAFSKHAVHGFAFELDRRLRAAGDPRASLLAHPGYAVNALAEKRPGVVSTASWWQRAGEIVSSPAAQGKDRGAWPVVRAAIDPSAESGEFYGPARMLRGEPIVVAPVASSASPDFGAHLWRFAEHHTGVEFRVTR
jgi:NAD(P)-dependent dehydrogenase (short-subunit alcohol dehydrogenase family)